MKHSKIFQNIFHPTDFSLASEMAYTHAIKIALRTKAKLRMIHYTEEGIVTNWDYFPKVKETLADWNMLSRDGSAKERQELGLQVEGIVATGPDVFSSILRHLKQETPDLMVLATHQIDGWNRWLYTPIAEHLARDARCPTLFVPPLAEGCVSHEDGSAMLKRVLIPVTPLIPPQLAIEYAVELAHVLAVEKIDWKIVHVGKEEHIPVVHLPTQKGWNWEKCARPGRPVDQLLEIATEFSPNLIAMMTEGHRGLFDLFQGSTTEQLIRSVRCPLLAVPIISPDN